MARDYGTPFCCRIQKNKMASRRMVFDEAARAEKRDNSPGRNTRKPGHEQDRASQRRFRYQLESARDAFSGFQCMP